MSGSAPTPSLSTSRAVASRATAPASAATPQAGYFENLDGLRFVSFLLVFLFHSFYTQNPGILGNGLYQFVAGGMFGNGNLGVNFFFVLSGFLITNVLLCDVERNGRIALGRFWLRRAPRIWPMYYAVVLFGFVGFPLLKQLMG